MSSVDLGLRGFLLLLAIWLCTKVFSSLWRLGGTQTTKLKGPESTNLLLGRMRYIMQSPDISVDYEKWAELYGPVYELPLAFGLKQIVLFDPRALTHCYNTERSVYVRLDSERQFIGEMFGRGVLWAEGEMHKRQRKALTPAFSNAAIRKLTSIFFDSAYKLKSFWDEKIETSPDGAVIIEVQEWMNRVALDSMGIAGFSHDFQYLEGKDSSVTAAFKSLELQEGSLFTNVIFFLGVLFPLLHKLPTQRIRLLRQLRRNLNEIAERLLESTRREKENDVAEEHADKSIIGLLLKAEHADAELYMTQEEVVAQMNVLLLAGYETTSVSLTWALIELAKHPEMQDKLRADLAQFGGRDPTWDQLSSTSDIPYLDAIVQEVLRLHPALHKTPRLASQDDVIPLGTPIVTPSGETISSVTVAKGTIILEPIRAINRSEALWGPDAKEFKPERWFKDITVPAKELQGHRHLVTFHDGPRTCLGKAFALAEFKAVLSVLIRNYSFEFPGGPDTKIEDHLAIVPRPKVAGEMGAKVPLRVKRL